MTCEWWTTNTHIIASLPSGFEPLSQVLQINALIILRHGFQPPVEARIREDGTREEVARRDHPHVLCVQRVREGLQYACEVLACAARYADAADVGRVVREGSSVVTRLRRGKEVLGLLGRFTRDRIERRKPFSEGVAERLVARVRSVLETGDVDGRVGEGLDGGGGEGCCGQEGGRGPASEEVYGFLF